MTYITAYRTKDRDNNEGNLGLSGQLNSYRKSAAASILDIPAVWVQRWCDAGVIKPHGSGGASGKPRKFSDANLFEMAVASELKRFGLNEQTLRAAVANICELPPDTDMAVLGVGARCEAFTTTDTESWLLRRQPVVVLHLSALRERARGGIPSREDR